MNISDGKSEWRTSLANLTAFAGKTIQIRFRLVSDASLSYKGWYVNGVQLKHEVLNIRGGVSKSGANLRTTGANDPLQGNLTNLDSRVFPRFIYAN